MLTGERRWGSLRKGGMTVLGKVAVPKPVNLPSQRLENHGLDPDVEIVPKGTLSWGSRTSSSVNAWVNPAVAPLVTNGSQCSVSHISDCLSRPSTAGSDISHEPVPNVWGPNSRPSSASGVLSSSHSSFRSIRPRSADTCPGSSQLSRFAESVAENSVAWAGPGTMDKLGSISKADSFSLTSGDFPSLGSVRISESNHQQGHTTHGRVFTSCDGAVTGDRALTSGTYDVPEHEGKYMEVDTWKDTSPYHAHGPPPGVDKWQNDAQQASQYTSGEVLSRYFEPCHISTRNHPPDGEWYRGGPPRAHYGPMPPRTGYPFDSSHIYGYYHPQPHAPVRPFAKARATQKAGAGSVKPYLGNIDTFQSHTPDSYLVPVPPLLPVRFPRHMPPREGCSQLSHENLRNSNALDAPPDTGASRKHEPYVHNRGQKHEILPDFGDFHGEEDGQGSPNTTKRVDDCRRTGEPSRQRSYEIILKRHNVGSDAGGMNRKESVLVPLQSEVGSHPVATAVEETDLKVDYRAQEYTDCIDLPSFHEESSLSYRSFQDGGVTSSVTLDAVDEATKVDVRDENMEKADLIVDLAEGTQIMPSVRKSQILLDKTEGRKTEADTNDGRSTSAKLLAANTAAGANVSTNQMITSGVHAENIAVGECQDPPRRGKSIIGSTFDGGSDPMERSAQIGDKGHSLPGRVMHVGINFKAKRKVIAQEGEEWIKKSSSVDASVTTMDAEVSSCELSEKQNSSSFDRGGEIIELDDYATQRAKMKEIAVQKAKQLQKEEEERVREQKAKALAKLEELDRRTIAGSLRGKVEIERVQQKQDDSGDFVAPDDKEKILESVSPFNTITKTSKNESSDSLLANLRGDSSKFLDSASAFSTVTKTSKNVSSISKVEDLPKKCVSEAPCLPPDGTVPINDSSISLGKDVSATGNTTVLHDNLISAERQIGHTNKLCVTQEEIQYDKFILHDKVVNTQDDAHASTYELSGLHPTEGTFKADDVAAQQRKKYIRNSKHKNRGDEIRQDDILQVSDAASISVPVEYPGETGKVKVCTPMKSEASSCSFKRNTVRQHHTENESSDGWTQSIQEVNNVRIPDQQKPQLSRKVSRANQVMRLSEKFHGNETVVWAPVKPASKQESAEETCQIGGQNNLAGTHGNGLPHNKKNRRAEMERYVPKPAVKEPSQNFSQAGILVQSKADGTKMAYGTGSTISGKAGYRVEHKSGDNKNDKHAKTWRQRFPPNSSVALRDPPEESSLSAVTKISQARDSSPPSKSQDQVPTHQVQHSNDGGKDELISTGNGGMGVNKDHEVPSGRGRRQQSKSQRDVSGHNERQPSGRGLKNEGTDKSIMHGPILEQNDAEGNSVHKISGRHVAPEYEWQPKGPADQSGRGGRRGGRRVVPVPGDQYHPNKSSSDGSNDAGLPEIPVPSISAIRNEQNHPLGKSIKDICPLEETELDVGEHIAENAGRCQQQQQKIYPSRHRPGQKSGRSSKGYGGVHHEEGHGLSWQELQSGRLPSNGDKRKQNKHLHYEYQAVNVSARAGDIFPNESNVSDELSLGRMHQINTSYQEHGENHPRHKSHGYGKSGGVAARSSSYGIG